MTDTLPGTVVRTLTITDVDYGRSAWFASEMMMQDPLRRPLPGTAQVSLTWEEWLAEGKPTDLVLSVSS